ncbi:MAG: hypothetical protein OXI01_14395 [Albidovulum sp.]|nr:hypothetical protein [Albidovulum sp.]
MGLALATDTLGALLDNGKFPSWKELILSPYMADWTAAKTRKT